MDITRTNHLDIRHVDGLLRIYVPLYRLSRGRSVPNLRHHPPRTQRKRETSGGTRIGGGYHRRKAQLIPPFCQYPITQEATALYTQEALNYRRVLPRRRLVRILGRSLVLPCLLVCHGGRGPKHPGSTDPGSSFHGLTHWGSGNVYRSNMEGEEEMDCRRGSVEVVSAW